MTIKMIEDLKTLDKKYGEKEAWNEFEWWALNQFTLAQFKAALEVGHHLMYKEMTYEQTDAIYNHYKHLIWDEIQAHPLEVLQDKFLSNHYELVDELIGIGVESLANKIKDQIYTFKTKGQRRLKND